VSHERIVKMIKDYHDDYYNLRKSFNHDKEKLNYRKKLENFVSEAKNRLFDVAFCKCYEVYMHMWKTPISCDCKVIMKCTCEQERKIYLI